MSKLAKLLGGPEETRDPRSISWRARGVPRGPQVNLQKLIREVPKVENKIRFGKCPR